MPRAAWIVLGVVGAVVAVAVVAYIARTFQRASALGRCEELKSQRAALAVQGTDPVTIARLDSEIRQCAQTASALGAEVDLGDVTLEACVSKHEQIEQEWAHYRSTEYSDPVKRNNTRSSILRFGEEMARCYQSAIEDAETVAGLDRIRAAISKSIGTAEARERCYLTDGTGCGRFALNEDHGNDKARAERERIIVPLRAAHDAATAKRDTVRAQESAALAALGSAKAA